VKVQDEDIPQRFLNGCDQDVKEARRRWDITRKWREEDGINNILNEPQPHFHTIKTMYPHYICSKSREGVYAWYERPGEIEVEQLGARNIHVNDMLRHWLYCTEFLYKHFASGHLDKCLSVIDMAGLSLSDVKGEALEFVRKTVSYANQHYPERAHTIFLVNVPSWFSWTYKMLKPLIHENTQKKVKILSKKEVLGGLSEFFDVSQIPVYYGGELDFEVGDKRGNGNDSCRFQSIEEVYMAKMTDRLNRRCAGEVVSDDEEDTSAIPTSTAGLDHQTSEDNSVSISEMNEPNGDDKPSKSTKSVFPTSNPFARNTSSSSSTSSNSEAKSNSGKPPLSPRPIFSSSNSSTNVKKMQMHLQESASSRPKSDDWSVSSLGMSTPPKPISVHPNKK